MPIETENDADLKFRAGSFNEACTMYSTAILGLDDSQNKKKIELLQKLGDSLQGAGRNQESICIFDQLLKTQTESDCREADKIVTHLRLAKAHYLCDQGQEAEVEFKTAYKLAKSQLPPKHLLHKTVAGCYADWLGKTGGDANLLSQLRREVKEADEASQEPKTGQGVLVSRGGPGIKIQDREPNSKGANDSSFAVDILSEEIESVHDEINLPPSDIQLNFEPSATIAHASVSNPTSRATLPLSTVRDDSESPEGRSWSDLPIRNQNAMRGSARSYFKDGTLSTVELDKVMLEERSWQRHLIKLVPLAICAVVFGFFVTSAVYEPSSKELPAIFQALVGKTFATTDDSLSLFASPAGFTLRGNGLKKTVRPMVWKGSFSDELRLLKGEYNKCIWITATASGLQDQSGLKFWDETSQESKIVNSMRIIAAGAQSFYQNNRRYPLPAEAKSLFTYRNPCTNAIEPVQAYSTISYFANAATRNEKLEVHINQGELFEKETSPKPGTIALLSIINKPNGMIELPNQRVECAVAYLHAFDSEGQLINYPTTGKTLILSLFKGVTEHSEDKTIVERYAKASICLSQGSPPSSGGVFLKYIGCILLVVALAVYLLRVRQTAGVD